ncbi:hypothetical protein ACYX7E_09990 [Luteimonas sp. RIT-PG2_3]
MKMEHGDYDLRGVDFETQLCGQITDTIIDADRLARLEHNNGFPNFALYRLVLAGDRQYLPAVRKWWVLFALEWCRTNMRSGYSEELATVAAWDSLQRAMDPSRPILVADEVAADLGVSLPTYLRARQNLSQVLGAVISSYWAWLQTTYRVVKAAERRVS